MALSRDRKPCLVGISAQGDSKISALAHLHGRDCSKSNDVPRLCTCAKCRLEMELMIGESDMITAECRDKQLRSEIFTSRLEILHPKQH